MTQAFDMWSSNEIGALDSAEEPQISIIMKCWEDGCGDDPEKEIVALSQFVAENAGRHDMARAMKEEINRIQDDGPNYDEDYE